MADLVKSAMCITRARPRPKPSLFFFPGLNNCQPILPNDWFGKLPTLLNKATPYILAEYNKLHAAQESSLKTAKSDYKLNADEHAIHKGNWDWNSFILKGATQEGTMAKCPNTLKLLRSIPGWMTSTPFAYTFFSSLAPAAKIESHYGPCNIRIRCHLPLLVPSHGDCGMEVGGETVR
jgi:aspartyl/asparaginyl beta-hydroxylase (cupin superfamily)